MKRTIFGALLLFSSISLFAQNQRTFVSGVGLDTNPCSVTSPCRSIPTALGVTNSGGEIIVLDSAGYGQSVTINKAVNIVVPPGIFAAMTPTTSGLSSTALYIAAGPSDTIRIDGLQILGAGVANNQVGVDIGACARTELTNMKIKSVAYPVKVLADVRVLLKNVDASVFTTGLTLSGINTNADTSTLKVLVHNSSFVFGTLGIQINTGALVINNDNVANGTHMAFLSQASFALGNNAASCITPFNAVFSGSSIVDTRTGAGGSVCYAP